jgi:hypothetical protein
MQTQSPTATIPPIPGDYSLLVRSFRPHPHGVDTTVG